MNNENNITGIILAGGKSTRMGSDKGFMEIGGTSFMSRIINTLTPYVKEIIIVSDNPDYDSFGLKRVEDIIKDSGPLAGLYTGLEHSKTEDNLVLSCDIPLINHEVISELTHACDSESDIVQIKSGGRIMPLVAMYKKRCLGPCLWLLKNGERRLRSIQTVSITKTIDLKFEYAPYVRNINTIEELKKIRHEIEH
jgi:molybdopterin-guanine dinucleotide biosynthesis protein A